MKLHSAWLAGALLVFAVLGCHFSANSNSTSSGAISEIHMAKDNNGSPGDETNTFAPGDHTVHCLARLNNAKEGTRIKFSWSIVDAGGTKNEKIKEIDYTTSSSDNVVHGHLTVPRDWPTGKYKCEVYVNGVLDKTIEYWVA
ncbi:MAG: hypothetical protein ABJC05_11925 [Pyrinomonadaceae bacterium]